VLGLQVWSKALTLSRVVNATFLNVKPAGRSLPFDLQRSRNHPRAFGVICLAARSHARVARGALADGMRWGPSPIGSNLAARKEYAQAPLNRSDYSVLEGRQRIVGHRTHALPLALERHHPPDRRPPDRRGQR
jgi:hypothetical protein